jgi:hypothetical protein
MMTSPGAVVASSVVWTSFVSECDTRISLLLGLPV